MSRGRHRVRTYAVFSFYFPEDGFVVFVRTYIAPTSRKKARTRMRYARNK